MTSPKARDLVAKARPMRSTPVEAGPPRPVAWVSPPGAVARRFLSLGWRPEGRDISRNPNRTGAPPSAGKTEILGDDEPQVMTKAKSSGMAGTVLIRLYF
jgi:hypothetical protein